MARRIWVSEGVASDGDLYGRALRLTNGNGGGANADADTRTGVRRRSGTILKSHLGDIPSCPCLAALVPVPAERNAEDATAAHVEVVRHG